MHYLEMLRKTICTENSVSCVCVVLCMCVCTRVVCAYKRYCVVYCSLSFTHMQVFVISDPFSGDVASVKQLRRMSTARRKSAKSAESAEKPKADKSV